MQISDNEDLATLALEVLGLFLGSNTFDETWEEEPQEDGGTCWTNDSSAPVPQCHDASSLDLPLYANGSGGTAGNSGNC